MVKRFAKLLIGLTAALGIVVFGALFWLTTSSGSDYISKKLTDTFQESAGLSISFDNIDVSLFPPGIKLINILVGTHDQKVNCEIAQTELTLSLLKLIGNNLAIEEVYLDSLKCSFLLTPGDLEKLRADKSEDESEIDLNKILDTLPEFSVFAMNNARVELKILDETKTEQGFFKLDGVGLDITSEDNKLEVRGLLKEGQFRWKTKKYKINEKATNIELRTAVSKDGLDIRFFFGQVAGIDFKIDQAYFPISLTKDNFKIQRCFVSVPLANLSRFPLDLPVLKGVFEYSGSLSSQKTQNGQSDFLKNDFYANGKIKLQDFELDNFIIGSVNADIDYNPDEISFDNTRIHTADGYLDLNGKLKFDKNLSIKFNTTLNGIELARLLDQVTVKRCPVTQKVYGNITMSGGLNPFSIKGLADLSVKNHTVWQNGYLSSNNTKILYLPFAKVRGKVTVNEDFFFGEDLKVTFDRTSLLVNMKTYFDDRSSWLTAKSKNFYTGDVKKIAGFNIKGHGPLQCRIDNLIGLPTIKGNTVLDNFEFNKMKFLNAQTSVLFKDLILSFENLNLLKGKSRTFVSELALDFNPPKGPDVHTKIEVEQVLLEDLAKTFKIDTRSFGSPTGKLFGRVVIDYKGKSDALKVTADLVHEDLRILGENFQTDIARITWNDGELTVTELGLTKGRGTLSITGNMQKNGALDFVAAANGINTTSIDNAAFKKANIISTAQIFAVVQGTLKHPEGWINIRLSDSKIGKITYGPSTVDLKLSGFKVSGTGNFGNGLILLEYLNADFKNEKFQIEGFVNQFDLLNAIAVKNLENNSFVNITGDISVKGKISSSPRIRGFGLLNSISGKIDDFSFKNEQPLELHIKDDFLKILKTRFSGHNVAIDVKGGIGLNNIDLSANGIAGLTPVALLTESIEKTNGTVNFEVKITGPWDNLLLGGKAKVKNGILKIQDFPHIIKDITGNIKVKNNKITFSDFKAEAAGGNLALAGKMSLDSGNIKKYKFKLKAADLLLMPISDLAFRVSTMGQGLILKKSPADKLPQITGDVAIEDLSYTQPIKAFELSDFSIKNLTGNKLRTSKVQLFDTKKDIFKYTINLHGTNNLVAKNKLYDVDLAIDDSGNPLALVGTNQTIGFNGRIFGKTGHVYFAGKRFNIRHSEVVFEDPLRPENPRFHITARGQVRDWKITLIASGKVDNYKIEFSSQPFLPSEDILFIILTGMTRVEHRQIQGSGIGLGAPLLGNIGLGADVIPLEFQVFTEYSEKAGTDTTRLSLGQWITPDTWVSVSASIGKERDVKASLEYKINDKFSLGWGFDNDEESRFGNIGFDLKYRLEF